MDIDHELSVAEVPCQSSMKFRSIIGFGKAFFIEDFSEKQKALDIILNHYNPIKPHKYQEIQVKKLAIIKIKVDSITGKKSGY
jgi:nitroimidazol reductase NimA-like FMN-containing flavoprotein (pyridoxamine 5'-phosphate oxidase superfamily)